MPVPTTHLDAPIAPYRAVTVAELTSRLGSEQTALMHVVEPTPDALSVEQLLRREGRWGMVPRTRHATTATAPGGPPPGRAAVRNSAPLVAPPPLHATARTSARRQAQAPGSGTAGIGPRAAGSAAPASHGSWTT